MVDAILTHLLVLSGSPISAIVFSRSTSALRPLFDIGNGDDGVYHLPLLVQDLVHGVTFKLGMLGTVIIHGDEQAQQVHDRWLDVQKTRIRARRKYDE
jgi:hypothetical protein